MQEFRVITPSRVVQVLWHYSVNDVIQYAVGRPPRARRSIVADQVLSHRSPKRCFASHDSGPFTRPACDLHSCWRSAGDPIELAPHLCQHAKVMSRRRVFKFPSSTSQIYKAGLKRAHPIASGLASECGTATSGRIDRAAHPMTFQPGLRCQRVFVYARALHQTQQSPSRTYPQSAHAVARAIVPQRRLGTVRCERLCRHSAPLKGIAGAGLVK